MQDTSDNNTDRDIPQSKLDTAQSSSPATSPASSKSAKVPALYSVTPLQHPQPRHQDQQSTVNGSSEGEKTSQTPQPPPTTTTPKPPARPHYQPFAYPQAAPHHAIYPSFPPANAYFHPRYTMAAVASQPAMPHSLPSIHNLPAFSPIEAGMTTHSHPQAFASAMMQGHSQATAATTATVPPALPAPPHPPRHSVASNNGSTSSLPAAPSPAVTSPPETLAEPPLEIGLSTIDQHASLHQASMIQHGEMGYFQGQYGQFSHSSDGQTWFSPLTPAPPPPSSAFSSFHQSHLPPMHSFTHTPTQASSQETALAPPFTASGSMTRSTSNPTLAGSPHLDETASSMMTRSYTSIPDRPFVYLQQQHPQQYTPGPPQSAASQYVSPYSSGMDHDGRHQNLARTLMTPATISSNSISTMSSPGVPSSTSGTFSRRKSSMSGDGHHSQMVAQQYGHYWHDGQLYEYPISQQEAIAQQNAQAHAAKHGYTIQGDNGVKPLGGKLAQTTAFQAAFQGKSHAQTNAFSYHSIDTEDETDIDKDDMVKREDAAIEADSPEVTCKVEVESEREATPILEHEPSVDSHGQSVRASPSPDPDAMSTDEYKPKATKTKKKKTARKVSTKKTIAKRSTSAAEKTRGRLSSAMSGMTMSPFTGFDEGLSPDIDPANVVYTENADERVTAEVRRICSVCHMTEPPSWRRSILTPAKILCNRCGIFERAHGKPRPTDPAELGYPPLPEKSRAGKRNGRKPPPKRMRAPRKRPEEMAPAEVEERNCKTSKSTKLKKSSKKPDFAMTAPSTPPSYAEQRRTSFGAVTVMGHHLSPHGSHGSSRSPYTSSPGTAHSTPMIYTPHSREPPRHQTIIYEPISGIHLQTL